MIRDVIETTIELSVILGAGAVFLAWCGYLATPWLPMVTP